MSMTPVEQQADNIKTGYEIAALHAEIDALRLSVESLQRDRNNLLIWGIMALGAAVMGMGMWIFNYVLQKKP